MGEKGKTKSENLFYTVTSPTRTGRAPTPPLRRGAVPAAEGEQARVATVAGPSLDPGATRDLILRPLDSGGLDQDVATVRGSREGRERPRTHTS